MDIVSRFIEIRDRVPATVKIVAVSKTKPASMIDELYSGAGHTIFGENKALELEEKYKQVPSDINWHFIGHLQTNKIKYIAPFVGMIQSVDSFRLLTEINKEAIKYNRIIPCLLEFHIATEKAKYGFSYEEVCSMVDDPKFQELTNISLKGVMGMATFTSNSQQISAEFKTLFSIFKSLQATYFASQPDFSEISMGMTDDYQLAIGEGSTMIRIGSGIFG